MSVQKRKEFALSFQSRYCVRREVKHSFDRVTSLKSVSIYKIFIKLAHFDFRLKSHTCNLDYILPLVFRIYFTHFCKCSIAHSCLFWVQIVITWYLPDTSPSKGLKTRNKMVGYVSCNQLLPLITAGESVICTSDDFLLSYSKQPSTIHNFAKIYCRISWTMILTNSGMTAGKNTLKQREKMELHFTEPNALKILAVCHLYTVLWLSLPLIRCWDFWRGCLWNSYDLHYQNIFLSESNADIYKSNDTHAPKNTPSQTEVFRCGTPSNSEVNRIALQRRTDYGNAIRKHMARPKSAGEFFCE